jgi:hypothetical protein
VRHHAVDAMVHQHGNAVPVGACRRAGRERDEAREEWS